MGRVLRVRSCCLGLGLWIFVVLGVWAVTNTVASAQNGADTSLLEDGFKSYREGDREAAIASFEKALAQQPSNDVVFKILEKVKLELVIEMTLDKDPKISGIGYDLLVIARTHQRKASDDAEAIATGVQKVLESEGAERIRIMTTLASQYGRNLVPALIPVLGDADIGNRADAFILIAEYLGQDAVPPLVAAWKHPNANVRVNIAKQDG